MDGQRSRYSVTLNAPTAAVENVGGSSTSYVDQDIIYHLSILDTSPSRDETHQYHTVVRVGIDDEAHESSTGQSSPAQKSTNINICTIEFSPLSQQTRVSPQILPTLHSSLENSFSVTWASNTVTGGSYCLIPIKFRNFAGPGNVALKLFVGTERIQIVDATVSRADHYEERFACVRLFSEGDAQKTRMAEITRATYAVKELRDAIKQAKPATDETNITRKHAGGKYKGHNKSDKRASRKQKIISVQVEDHDDLAEELASAEAKLSSVRPVQIFRLVASVRSEPPPCHRPSQQTKRSKSDSQRRRKRKDYKSTKPSHSEVAQNRTTAQAQVRENIADLCPTVPSAHEPKRPAPALCFYIRPEHVPNADHLAIYLPEQNLSCLLSAISSKLRIDIGMIGMIYYYDQQMTAVAINEESVKFVPHEQDLVVQLGCIANQFRGPPIDMQFQLPFSAQSFNSHNDVYDQYLPLPPNDAYATSVESWSDWSESISMNHVFAQSSTPRSSLNDVHYDESPYQQPLVSGDHGIDYHNFAYDQIPNISVGTNSPLSARLNNTMQICAQIPAHPQIFHPQAEPQQLKTQYSPPITLTPATNEPLTVQVHQTPSPLERRIINPDGPRFNSVEKEALKALERNRMAALKCRITRREKELRLQELSQEKLEQNMNLKQEVKRLQAEILEAKGLLKMHVGCV